LKHTPPLFLGLSGDYGNDKTFLGCICLVDVPQSRGTVTLRSRNPNDKPLIDPKFLTHPYDRRAMIEGLRYATKVLKAPIYKEKTIEFIGPKDDTDEALWVSSFFHSWLCHFTPGWDTELSDWFRFRWALQLSR
jgi:choline dehydrogenase-like flavoprotein